jgi:nucleotide-binding universal stress UspA family protein
MPEWSRVLCAVNLTEPSRRVLDCALWWARRHGADVSVLHVHALPVPTADEGSTPPPARPTLTPEERSEHQLDVERFVEQARTDGVEIEVLLDEDVSIADAVVARADALAADLVVVGAGTNPSSEHASLGQITAAVLRGAHCSVLVIPAPAADVVNPCVTGIKNVMCAVSLSEQSRPVLDAAVALAAEDAAHLSVVHVVELSEVAALAYDFDAHREARLQPACEDLVALVASAVGDKPVEEIVAQGTASHEILKLAAEESTDLIVVGTGRAPRTPVGRPAAQAVAREARCPVLFVHAEPAAASLRLNDGDAQATQPVLGS